jgi:hypothetical protein
MALTRCAHLLRTRLQLTHTLLPLLYDGIRFLGLCLCPSPILPAENLFLRKQLAMYQERRGQTPTTDACHPPRPRLARSLVRLASGLVRSATRDLHPLASPRIWSVLALEIEARSTPHSG